MFKLSQWFLVKTVAINRKYKGFQVINTVQEKQMSLLYKCQVILLQYPDKKEEHKNDPLNKLWIDYDFKYYITNYFWEK